MIQPRVMSKDGTQQGVLKVTGETIRCQSEELRLLKVCMEDTNNEGCCSRTQHKYVADLTE